MQRRATHATNNYHLWSVPTSPDVLDISFDTPGLSLEDAVPPSDLHLDEDFDKLEDRDKSRKGAGAFLKQIKK